MPARVPARHVALKDGRTVQDPRLDRLPLFDVESRRYTIRAHLETALPTRRLRAITWQPGRITLDQGHWGACVGASGANGRNASPNRAHPPLDFEHYALPLYFQLQQEDPWSGGEYPGANPVYSGTAVLTHMQHAKREGWISEYRWIGAGSGKVADDIWDTLRYVGGIQLGIPWYESQYEPDPYGVVTIDPASGLAGYHAIWAVAARYAALPGTRRPKVEHAVLHQSWGYDWGGTFYGVRGFAFVPIVDIAEKWMPAEGEGAVPILL